MTDLLDMIEASAARDRGMALASEAQERDTPGFGEAAYDCIVMLAMRQEYVHIDDFLMVFRQKPEHPNAFGAPWQRAKRDRIIEHSGQVRKCTADPLKNCHLYPVYRSLIYRRAA